MSAGFREAIGPRLVSFSGPLGRTAGMRAVLEGLHGEIAARNQAQEALARRAEEMAQFNPTAAQRAASGRTRHPESRTANRGSDA